MASPDGVPGADGARLRIRGGRPLRGSLPVHAAKNAVLPVLAASLLSSGELVVHDLPDLEDVRTMACLLSDLGVGVHVGPDCWSLRVPSTINPEAPYPLVRRMRASVLVMGPLLGRFGRARVGMPGGCAIGTRPIDLHLKGFSALGAEVRVDGGYVDVRAPAGGLHGARLYLDYPSVTATENVMMAAAVARGRTIIENAAEEPEVVDLANCLNAMGARLSGAGTRVVRIEGRRELGSADHVPIPDRIEAGTYLVAAAMTGGECELRGVIAGHLQSTVAKLREIGAEVWQEEGRLLLVGPRRPRAVDVKTLPYPGFATDLQPQFSAMLCVADGTSVVSETVFDNRLGHMGELKRMGAEVRVEGSSSVITGIPCLSGAPVVAADLRAGAALVLAGLVADGETEVSGIHHIERGYVNLAGALAALGADVQTVRRDAPAPVSRF